MRPVRSNKQRLGRLTGLMMACVMAFAILALNLVFTRFIETEANRAIAREADNYLQEAGNLLAQDVYKSSPVTVNSLLLNPDLRPDDDFYYAYSLTRLERAVIAHLQMSGLPEGVQRLSLLGEELYLKAFLLDRDEGDRAMAVVLYANVSPLKQFLLLLNVIFLILLLGFGALAAFIGLRLGRKIDDTQSRMRRFFANASHELKTPLTIISGYAEGLKLGLVPDSAQAGGAILSASLRMESLVEELLLISKMESGAMKPRYETLSTLDLARDCSEDLREQAEKAGVIIQIAGEEDLPDLTADRALMKRALSNLLQNALRFAKEHVSITLTEAAGRVRIEVSDDGPGIEEKDLPHLFERFYTGEKGQSGVGLSIAQEIVLLHGGSLSAANSGKGAVFLMTLPLKP